MYREADFLTSVCMSGVADLVRSPSDVGPMASWGSARRCSAQVMKSSSLVVKNIGLVGGDWNMELYDIL
jgi:hypothetical protein